MHKCLSYMDMNIEYTHTQIYIYCPRQRPKTSPWGMRGRLKSLRHTIINEVGRVFVPYERFITVMLQPIFVKKKKEV